MICSRDLKLPVLVGVAVICKLSSTHMEVQEGKGYRRFSPRRGSALHRTSRRWMYSLSLCINILPIGIHESVVKSAIFAVDACCKLAIGYE
jgi:hypothetical protein